MGAWPLWVVAYAITLWITACTVWLATRQTGDVPLTYFIERVIE